jgi:hypothetical protein
VHEIGVVVWAIVVIAGVVSSIAKSARKRAAINAAAPNPALASAQRLAEVRRLARTIAVRVDPAGNVVAPARPAGQPVPAAPRPVSAAVAAPAPVVTPGTGDTAALLSAAAAQLPSWPTGSLDRQAHRAVERLYRNRHALADAIVAAEVLGKPLALRNEYADR